MAGDKVLVTASEHNPLATHILAGGRRLCALVESPDKAGTVEKQVRGALAAAMAAGWFKELAHAGVPLGGSVLPAGFPPHNMSKATRDEIDIHREAYEDDDESGEWMLDVAKAAVAGFGFEIKVSASTPAPAFRKLCLYNSGPEPLMIPTMFFVFMQCDGWIFMSHGWSVVASKMFWRPCAFVSSSSYCASGCETFIDIAHAYPSVRA